MSIDHLTKTQVVLLTLLVSFVTAIVTAIATVSLTSTSSDSVGQTIVRVVEKTIDKVTDLGTSTPRTETKTQTQIKYATNTIVRVNETDFSLLNALSDARKSVVRIYSVSNSGTSSAKTFISLGVIRNRDGLVSALIGSLPSGAGSYKAVSSDGDEFNLNLVQAPDQQGVALFNLYDQSSISHTYPAIKTADSNKVNSGSRVVVLSGQTDNISSIVYIKSLMALGSNAWETATPQGLKRIQTEPVLDEKIKGAVLVNERGELLGLRSIEDPNIFVYLQ